MPDSKPSPWLPLAIVIAGVLIGGGLYAGLRSRGTATPPTTSAAPTTTASAPVSQAQPESQFAIVTGVTKALSSQRKNYLEACGAGIEGVGFRITFDPAGKETGRIAMIPPNSPVDPKVVECASGVKAEPLVIPPPGKVVSTEVVMPPP